jgi:plastocyanin
LSFAGRATLTLVLLQLGCIDFGYPVDRDAAVADAGPQDAADPTDAAAPTDAQIADSGLAPDAGSGCVEGSVDLATAGTEVRVISFAVNRPAVTIVAGSVVIWRNADSMAHQLIAGVPGAPQNAANGGFDTGELAPGQGYAHRFCRPRRLVYYCSTHPSIMNGYRLDIQ